MYQKKDVTLVHGPLAWEYYLCIHQRNRNPCIADQHSVQVCHVINFLIIIDYDHAVTQFSLVYLFSHLSETAEPIGLKFWGENPFGLGIPNLCEGKWYQATVL